MCKFCKSYDFGSVGFNFICGDECPGVIYFPCQIGNVPRNERFNFCPVCGEKLTEKNFPSVKRKEVNEYGKRD